VEVSKKGMRNMMMRNHTILFLIDETVGILTLKPQSFSKPLSLDSDHSFNLFCNRTV